MKTLEILDIFKVNKIGRFINSFNKLSIRPFRFNLPKDTIFKKEQTILKGSKILYKSLIKNKVDTAFIYSGGSVMPLIDEWRSDLWIVTHVDLHRTAKVKACSDLIKKQAQLILSRNS